MDSPSLFDSVVDQSDEAEAERFRNVPQFTIDPYDVESLAFGFGLDDGAPN